MDIKDFGEQMEIVATMLDDEKIEDYFKQIEKAKELKNKVKTSALMAHLVAHCIEKYEKETLRLVELATGKKADELTKEEAQKAAFGVLLSSLGSFFA